RRERKAKLASRRDGDHWLPETARQNRRRHSSVSGSDKVAIAHLAFAAGAPCPDRTIGLERQVMIRTARRNGDDRTQTDYLNRRGHALNPPCVKVAIKVPITQLAIQAVAPSPHFAVGLERQAVPKAACNRHDTAQTDYLNRRGQSFVSSGVKVAIAQLPSVAEAPGPYCAV